MGHGGSWDRKRAWGGGKINKYLVSREHVDICLSVPVLLLILAFDFGYLGNLTSWIIFFGNEPLPSPVQKWMLALRYRSLTGSEDTRSVPMSASCAFGIQWHFPLRRSRHYCANTEFLTQSKTSYRTTSTTTIRYPHPHKPHPPEPAALKNGHQKSFVQWNGFTCLVPFTLNAWPFFTLIVLGSILCVEEGRS